MCYQPYRLSSRHQSSVPCSDPVKQGAPTRAIITHGMKMWRSISHGHALVRLVLSLHKACNRSAVNLQRAFSSTSAAHASYWGPHDLCFFQPRNSFFRDNGEHVRSLETRPRLPQVIVCVFLSMILCCLVTTLKEWWIGTVCIARLVVLRSFYCLFQS
jgi:hypothetical protein